MESFLVWGFLLPLLLISAVPPSSPLVERLWAIGEKIAEGLLAFLGGLLVVWWRRRQQRVRAERAERHRRAALLEALSNAVIVLLEEANFRDWSTSTGRFAQIDVDPAVSCGVHRERRQQATTLLRAAAGIAERRHSSPDERAEFARRMRQG